MKVSRTKVGKLVVDAFEADVPRVHVNRHDPRMVEMTRVYMRMGATPDIAARYAADGVEALFRGSYLTKLKLFVAHQARRYVKAYGDLEGFAPEVLARVYVPDANKKLRGKRNVVVRATLVEMRRTWEVANG